QMPKGIPVATVAIDNAANAALLALRILGTQDKKIHKALLQQQKDMKAKVKNSNKTLKTKLAQFLKD
ncbi:MAG: AIR carboxylase family protein, partial [Bdellovibrionaceae bacterium]|nr:AIR carboxylase family protein [Pseudobdellovibrionaceae bacterium]